MSTTQQASTTRFGVIEVSSGDVVSMPEGILGFPDSHRYVVIEHKPGSPFRWLQSLDEAAVAFLVVDPCTYIADYAPEIDDREAMVIELTAESAQLVYTIVNVPKGKPEEMTLNLAGPIVINADSRLAKQFVLDDSVYSIKYTPSRSANQPEGAAA
ncbi:MAG: flagellar assembly protein FliW [Chthonomonas sp.]|nr:flagellar assembly protein FliW [Chthonomonas sp.]